MSAATDDRVSNLIHAYFALPHDQYSEMVEDLRRAGGLTPLEVRVLKDQLLFIHSDTIIRQVGLAGT